MTVDRLQGVHGVADRARRKFARQQSIHVWDRALADIESFRLRRCQRPKRALGREVERSAQRERQRQTQRQIREANRQLGRGEFAAQRRSIERGGLSIGR
jgi:hypothetical protein